MKAQTSAVQATRRGAIQRLRHFILISQRLFDVLRSRSAHAGGYSLE
jgi:hypothetical protein